MLIIKSRKKRSLGLNEPLRHESHKKPVTRRDFLAQGFTTGAATVVAPAVLGTLLGARKAQAQAVTLAPDIDFMADPAHNICNIQQGAAKIPFICFDLAGGANIAGSNVLVGKEGGQLDFLSTQGYSKQGLPGTMLPNSATTDFINEEFGLMFHSDSAFLRGMLEKTSATTRAFVNGCVIAARSENDTGNNPHNPMYGIAKAGARGELLTLIGSQNSDSGGNSMAPAMLMDPANRPTKIDRATDASGLVDTGALGTLFTKPDNTPDTQSTVAVMEQMARISEQKLLKVDPKLVNAGDGARLETQVKCGYVRTADTVARFSSPAAINPAVDPDITGAAGTFGPNFGNDGEFQKTASVMKLVVEGYAGAGTISMGGFDYHTGDRATGEQRDLRAGRCIGACLEFAARRGKPLMIYVFSDGSLSSNGMIDSSVNGRGKGVWTGDNQQTAAAFFLVFNPGARPALLTSGAGAARHQQIGAYSAGGDVVNSSSPAANNVNLLVQTVLLNYMALHGEQGQFNAKFGSALGTGAAALDGLTAFAPIVNGKIGG